MEESQQMMIKEGIIEYMKTKTVQRCDVKR